MPQDRSAATPTTSGGLVLAQSLVLLRFAVRAVRITASTIAVVALLLLQAPRLFPLLQDSETG